MRFIADENVEYIIVSNLRNSGHDIVYVAEISPSVDDDSILKNANDSDSILITNDKDFGELVFRQNRISEGVILLRLDGLSNEMKVEYVLKAIDVLTV